MTFTLRETKATSAAIVYEGPLPFSVSVATLMQQFKQLQSFSNHQSISSKNITLFCCQPYIGYHKYDIAFGFKIMSNRK